MLKVNPPEELGHQAIDHDVVVCIGGESVGQVVVKLTVPGRAYDIVFTPEAEEAFSEAHSELSREIANALLVRYAIDRHPETPGQADHAWLVWQLNLLEAGKRKLGIRKQPLDVLQSLYNGHCKLIADRLQRQPARGTA